MFSNNPFEQVNKALVGGFGQLTPDAMQSVAKGVMDNWRAWADLLQLQVKSAQECGRESIEEFKTVREPKAAFEAARSGFQRASALAAENLQQSVALGIEQFTAGVDLMQASHPLPDLFAPVAHGLKLAAASSENLILGALASGAGSSQAMQDAGKPRSRHSRKVDVG